MSETLKKQIIDRTYEIKKDHDTYFKNYLENHFIKTPEALCNDCGILKLGFAYEIKEYLVKKLEGVVDEKYENLTDDIILMLELGTVFDEIMHWCDDQEYSPNITSWSEIDMWMIDALEQIQEWQDGACNGCGEPLHRHADNCSKQNQSQEEM